MNFYYISPLQQIEIVISVVLFLILIGFIRNIFVYHEINSVQIVFLTILFGLWYLLTKLFTNTMVYFILYDKLYN
jgi:hypothetical protein